MKYNNDHIQVEGKPEITMKQAGAELCQALEKLGLAKAALPSNKLIGHPVKKTFRSSSIYQKIEVVFHLC